MSKNTVGTAGPWFSAWILSEWVRGDMGMGLRLGCGRAGGFSRVAQGPRFFLVIVELL